MASSKKPRKKRNNNAAMVKYSDRLAKGSMIISVPYLGFQRLLDFKGIGEIRAEKLLNAFVDLISTQQDKLVNYLKLEEICAKRREDKETIEQARNWRLKEA